MKNNAMFFAFGLILPVAGAWAGNVTIPNSFSASTPAVAADVNANFDAVATEIDDNDARITTNAASITAGDGTNATAITANATNITANATAITANATAITANATNITTNTTATTANATNITTNATASTANASDITTNATAITAGDNTNATALANHDADAATHHQLQVMWSAYDSRTYVYTADTSIILGNSINITVPASGFLVLSGGAMIQNISAGDDSFGIDVNLDGNGLPIGGTNDVYEAIIQLPTNGVGRLNYSLVTPITAGDFTISNGYAGITTGTYDVWAESLTVTFVPTAGGTVTIN